MEHNDTSDADSTGQAKTSTHATWGDSHIPLVLWWYRLVTPPDPPATASLAQREKIRHARLASFIVPLFMLFLLNLLPQAISSKSILQVVPLVEGEMLCVVALFLNRRGWVHIAGILLFIQDIIGLTSAIWTAPGGLTFMSLYRLDFTIVPDILVLSFFSANMLFLVLALLLFRRGY